jgi:hypothetical protein
MALGLPHFRHNQSRLEIDRTGEMRTGIVTWAVHKQFILAAVGRLEQGLSLPEARPSARGESERASPQASRVPAGSQATPFPGNRKIAGQKRRVPELGTEGGPSSHGRSIFEGVLAAHRGAADAAGVRGLPVNRTVELGR